MVSPTARNKTISCRLYTAEHTSSRTERRCNLGLELLWEVFGEWDMLLPSGVGGREESSGVLLALKLATYCSQTAKRPQCRLHRGHCDYCAAGTVSSAGRLTFNIGNERSPAWSVRLQRCQDHEFCLNLDQKSKKPPSKTVN